MIRKRFIIGLLLLFIGFADLFFSRNLIYNYVYGPHPSDFGNCVRIMRPPYYYTLMLKEEYVILTGDMNSSDNPEYDAPGPNSFYSFRRPASTLILKAPDHFTIESDTFKNSVCSGVLVDCDYKTPEERELKKRLDRDYAAYPQEYPYVYFDTTADISNKKLFAWFQYITSVVLLVAGLLFLLRSFFRRKLPSVNN